MLVSSKFPLLRFRRLLGTLALAAAFAITLSSCTTCCPPERCTPPPTSKFSRITIPVPSSSESYPAWQTRSSGPPILLLHALNGISPSTLHFALEMESWGYRVYLPSLYGDPIEGASAFGYDDALAATKFLGDDTRWNLFSSEDPGPILNDIRSMTRWISEQEGGREIVVIGNCLTGNFPIALLEEPSVRVAVLAQPALPVPKLHEVLFRIPRSPRERRSLALPAKVLDNALRALRENPDKRIIGFHYRNDPIAPIVKFDVLRKTLSEAGLEDRFTAFVLGPTGQRYSRKRPEWVIGGSTEQPRRMATPHSTLINPESLEDRAWFRAQLRKQLERSYSPTVSVR